MEPFPVNPLRTLHPGKCVGWYSMTKAQATFLLKHLDSITKDRLEEDAPAP